jgi:hypothetical protein
MLDARAEGRPLNPTGTQDIVGPLNVPLPDSPFSAFPGRRCWTCAEPSGIDFFSNVTSFEFVVSPFRFHHIHVIILSHEASGDYGRAFSSVLCTIRTPMILSQIHFYCDV